MSVAALLVCSLAAGLWQLASEEPAETTPPAPISTTPPPEPVETANQVRGDVYHLAIKDPAALADAWEQHHARQTLESLSLSGSMLGT